MMKFIAVGILSLVALQNINSVAAACNSTLGEALLALTKEVEPFKEWGTEVSEEILKVVEDAKVYFPNWLAAGYNMTAGKVSEDTCSVVSVQLLQMAVETNNTAKNMEAIIEKVTPFIKFAQELSYALAIA